MTNHHDASKASASRDGGIVRPLLWALLIISGACNMVLSGSGVNTAAGIASGAVTLAIAIALITHHYRTRRR
ncbi:hypothetical protein Acsp04_58500 [Actinomadura sp. NBRC 104425]|uniref:hypothetical protein n=1 Tax=Actinomadura sp. NBRC 104425 TaxID=3032204 RepID=UPI0024A435DA|nr:hypothetical protein [Actinomadura sp. NBRC 104425]GLZ15615.1 hypothetical protein Acsp04_58500 [Actinomadura sp. NBRC 104425]